MAEQAMVYEFWTLTPSRDGYKYEVLYPDGTRSTPIVVSEPPFATVRADEFDEPPSRIVARHPYTVADAIRAGCERATQFDPDDYVFLTSTEGD